MDNGVSINGKSTTTTIGRDKHIINNNQITRISITDYQFFEFKDFLHLVKYLLAIAMAYYLMDCVIFPNYNNTHITTLIVMLLLTVTQTIQFQTQLLSPTITIHTNQQQFKQLHGCIHNQTQLLSPTITQTLEINHVNVNVNKQGLPQLADCSFTLHKQKIPILRPTSLPSDEQQLKEIYLLMQLLQYLVLIILLLMQLFQQLLIQLSCYFFVFLVASVTCVGGVSGGENLFNF